MTIDHFSKLYPDLSFKLWLQTKDFIISKHYYDNKDFLKTITDETWREDFKLGKSPLASVISYIDKGEHYGKDV